ncbi:MAG: hypothetical protein PF487_14570 [Bacteroidales bacterium]|jgi:hypothetical protein|nr:hypothetical protein [Bacteroidales bacterium]
MDIKYDSDFEKVMNELQTNFGWSNIEALPHSYRDLLNDTIKAVKNCSIHNVVVEKSEELKPLDADLLKILNELAKNKVNNKPTKKRF